MSRKYASSVRLEQLETRQLLSAAVLDCSVQFKAPAIILPATKHSATLKITNTGGDLAKTTLPITVYVSDQPTLNWSDSTQQAIITIDPKVAIKSGKTKNVPIHFRMPTSFVRGDCYVLVNVNDQGSVGQGSGTPIEGLQVSTKYIASHNVVYSGPPKMYNPSGGDESIYSGAYDGTWTAAGQTNAFDLNIHSFWTGEVLSDLILGGNFSAIPIVDDGTIVAKLPVESVKSTISAGGHFNLVGQSTFPSGSSTNPSGSNSIQGQALVVGVTGSTTISNLGGANQTGVRLGTIQINVGTNTADVNLSGESDLQDVINAINNAGLDLTASIGTDDQSLLLTPGISSDRISVQEVGNSTTAADLGILQTTALPVLVGQPLNAKLTSTTLLSSLNGGAGISNAGFLINDGTTTKSVDVPSGAATVGDLLSAIHQSASFVTAQINSDGTGINIVDSSAGASLTISENGGTTASDLGILSSSGNGSSGNSGGSGSNGSSSSGSSGTSGSGNSTGSSSAGTKVFLSLSGNINVHTGEITGSISLRFKNGVFAGHGSFDVIASL